MVGPCGEKNLGTVHGAFVKIFGLRIVLVGGDRAPHVPESSCLSRRCFLEGTRAAKLVGHKPDLVRGPGWLSLRRRRLPNPPRALRTILEFVKIIQWSS